jgi:Mg2+/Co2+ transporter CorB
VKCRNAETTIKVARLSYLGKTGIVVAAGLAAAFLILVFADLLQSFFDTASNSGAIRGILENKND